MKNGNDLCGSKKSANRSHEGKHFFVHNTRGGGVFVCVQEKIGFGHEERVDNSYVRLRGVLEFTINTTKAMWLTKTMTPRSPTRLAGEQN